ncbi:MAG: hypothetical protein II793_01455 [Bacteroidales bacterium]|nr:hypothetical protein [Bacteroidales bacterium]
MAQKAVSLGGTVTAEHGIGKVKHPFLLAMLENRLRYRSTPLPHLPRRRFPMACRTH